ncbi:MAG: ribosome small subunit-dependent GTPase A [Rubrivivax sp.]
MNEPLNLATLGGLGWTPALQQAWAQRAPDTEPGPAPTPMRVAEVHRDRLQLHDGLVEHPARVRSALLTELAAQADALAVGDWVLATRNTLGEWWVAQRLPPRTQLARRLHDGRDKVERVVIASNIDTALLVMGLDHDFNLRRLERYLALVRLAGVGAVVVLTKADLCDQPAQRLAQVQAMVPPDVGVVALNALAEEPAPSLAPWLQPGQTLVLLGSSGVGKSTLTNALLGQAVQATGGNRHGDGRGRHTTTTRSLHRTASGACIVDTPGLRTLRLDSEAGDIAGVFGEVARLAPACRFRNCRHQGEPGCAVREAVPAERLDSFHKLQREAQRDSLSALQKKALVSQWKARGRATRQHLKAKRGEGGEGGGGPRGDA